jgi:uncharacterized membrane protein
MHKFYRLLVLAYFLCTAFTAAVLPSTPAYAQDALAPTNANAGLTISPLRTNPSMKAGTSRTQKLTIENRTPRPMRITLNYERFSLGDGTYDYSFYPVDKDIIRFEISDFTLTANTSRAIAYQISVPADFTPGGYYYTIFATNKSKNGSIETQSRVGSLIFLTVDGNLDRTTSIIQTQAPSFSVRPRIPVSVKLENTGNVHSENVVTTELSGSMMTTQKVSSLHLVIPGTVRTLSYNIAAPRFPGIYTIHISSNNGYTPPSTTTLQIAYIPIWCIAFGIALAILGGSAVRKRKRQKKSPEPKPDQNVPGTAV